MGPGSPIRRSARDRLEEALARIADPRGESKRTYLTVYADRARAEADAADRRAASGTALSPLDGAIVSIKDLFDVAGEPTRAGSKVLADAPPAATDASVVQRLRKAGAVIVGKTNMSEFAFSIIGTNSHYGTPGNPADRSRIPGGSTSGGAVAVADGMCEIAIGTDTGGSCRVPAALCGIVGYKPTKSRVPTEGAYPLSPTLDSVGPLARTVEDCAKADAILAGEKPWTLEQAPLQGLRLAVPQGLPLRDLDATVSAAFDAATRQLGQAAAELFETQFPLLDEMARVNSRAAISLVEGFRIHKDRLATQPENYDPFVRARLENGRNVASAELAEVLDERNKLVREMDSALSSFDALILPTNAIVAPTMAEVSTLEGFVARNRLLLRNTGIANFFDLCAISLPMPHPGPLPTGLMLVARRGQDRRLFQIAAAVEGLLTGN